MIDRLHNALLSLEQLSAEAQEEAATYIEALIEGFKMASIIQSHTGDEGGQGLADIRWQDLLGALGNLPDATRDDLDPLHQPNQPMPPLEQS